MPFDYNTLITDRTQSDVDDARRLIETGGPIPQNHRGFYNASDRNRVGSAAAALAAALAGYGYHTGPVAGKSDWAPDTDVTPVNSANCLADIKSLKDSFYGATPLPDTMDYIDHNTANNIEKLLFEVAGHIGLMERAFARCGAFSSGQEVIFPT